MTVVAAHDEYIKTIFDSSNIFLCSGACCRMKGSFITQLVRPRVVVTIWHACKLLVLVMYTVYWEPLQTCSFVYLSCLSCIRPTLQTGRTELCEDDE